MSSTNQEGDTGNHDQELVHEEQALQSSNSDNNKSSPGEDNDKEKNANPIEWDGPNDPVRLCSPRAILHVGVLTFNCISATQETSLQ